MPRQARSRTSTSAQRPSRKAARHRAKRGVFMASVGGLGLVWVFGLAGCAAVVAGAAAGMLASRTGTSGGTAEVSTSTPTVGESVDQLADSAGQVLARTIKESVPRTVRAVPAGTPKVVGKPSTVRTPGIATPLKAAETQEPALD